ncbi:gp35 hinge connector of long tail fiber [Acinetobacter phage Ac42]|uniref:long tail fiber protein proximal connector n=1 Tax=Acinetobacter phage Ac42 TaxID=762660 RepID=UPI0001EBCE1C|nr:long tail fiber protein proximal connector [Acinetobacter phage Ac42]ADI96480.1 gp35 hinge connector of long tail fiber [Acinetobacter phage Ac42]
MEHFAASFGLDMVTVQTLSETNAVTYKLNAAGVTVHSVPAVPYVFLNDQPLGVQTHSNGLNVRVIGPNNTVIDRKEFILTNIDSSTNTAFVTYMDSLTSGIVVITSGPNLKTSPSVDAWFKSVYSVNWPGSFLINNYAVAYAAIYKPSHKKIAMETYKADDGSDKTRAVIETVYDTESDIGATGFAHKAIYDPTVYQSSTTYEFKRYPTDQVLISLLSDYGIQPGDTFMFSGEAYASQALVDANMSTRINLRWYKGTTLLEAKSVEVPKTLPDQWIKFEEFTTVPATADGFTIAVARYPRNDAVNALAQVRNITFNEVGRPDTLTGDAAIGVNGIKTSNLEDNATFPNLITFPDAAIKLKNTVNVINVTELPLPY